MSELLQYGVKDLGIRFSLQPEYEKIIRTTPYSFGFSDSQFGEIVYFCMYSRIMSDGRQERWPDTVLRVINGVMTIRKWWYMVHHLRWHENRMQDLALRMGLAMMAMRWLPPGRGLWAMGTDYLYERGGLCLYNCGFTEIHNIAEDCAWLMDCLMAGVGVGFGIPTLSSFYSDCHPVGVYLPAPASDREVYVIPDSREGCVTSVKKLIESYTFIGRKYLDFDYSGIREAGKTIKGFGGIASGPEPLKLLHERIRQYFKDYTENRIPYTHLLANICNAIGCCIVSGNVRRSAELCLGSVYDESFLNLKNYAKYPDRLSIGWVSNNSVRLETEEDFIKIPNLAEHFLRNGEPGIVNMINVHRYGRYQETIYGEDQATGLNPCGEVPLENKELCNLAEVFPTRCKHKDEFFEALEFATFYSSTVNLYPTNHPVTNEVIARNRRIGVSLSGIAEWVEQNGMGPCILWLRDGYKWVRDSNKRFAEEAGVAPSIRVTTVKPSGSISQLVGVSSGMHFPAFSYAMRRIRIPRQSELTKLLIKAGYPWEPVVEFVPTEEAQKENREIFEKYHTAASQVMVPVKSESSLVFEIPLARESVRNAREVSAWEQFAMLAMLQREWADNSVSCTISYDKEKEGHQINTMLYQYIYLIKSISLLPYFDEGVYPQMPYEGITKDEYEHRIRQLRSVSWQNFTGLNDAGPLYCTNEQCEVLSTSS